MAKVNPFKHTFMSVCTCHFEPRGDNGLEGYQLDGLYVCQFVETLTGTRYWRVWPVANDEDYYEVCGTVMFNRYFKELK